MTFDSSGPEIAGGRSEGFGLVRVVERVGLVIAGLTAFAASLGLIAAVTSLGWSLVQELISPEKSDSFDLSLQLGMRVVIVLVMLLVLFASLQFAAILGDDESPKEGSQ